jgi:hypothetical protein
LQKQQFSKKEDILKKLKEKAETQKRWEENASNLREVAEFKEKEKMQKRQEASEKFIREKQEY